VCRDGFSGDISILLGSKENGLGVVLSQEKVMAGIALDCYEAGNVISMIAFFTRIRPAGSLVSFAWSYELSWQRRCGVGSIALVIGTLLNN
jgi:hypothetical protein